MKILAIDIGAKTQDILLYDDSIKIENCIIGYPASLHLCFREEVVCSAGDLFIKKNTRFL